MKVVCDSCHTRYAIADEKVRGKTFKIKCKKCGAYMVVRPHAGESGAEATGDGGTHDPAGHGEAGPALGAASAQPQASAADPGVSESTAESSPYGGADDDKETRVFNAAEFERLMSDRGDEGAPAAVVGSTRAVSSGDPEWYLLLGEEQVGPMTVADVEALVRRGDANGDTYAWREGLADWQPVREISALAALVGPGSAEALADEPTRAQAPSRDLGGVGLAAQSSEFAPTPRGRSPETSRDGAGFGASLAASAPSPAGPSLFDAASAGHAEADEPASPFAEAMASSGGDGAVGLARLGGNGASPRVVVSPPSEDASGERRMTAQRHEDSVLFSLKSLGVVNFREGEGAAKATVIEPSASSPMRPVALSPVSSDARPALVGGAIGGAAASPRDLDVPLPPPIVVPTRGGMPAGTKVIIAMLALLLLGGGAVLAWFLTRGEPAKVARGAEVKSGAPPSTTSTPPLPPVALPVAPTAGKGGAASATPAATGLQVAAAPPAPAPEMKAPEGEEDEEVVDERTKRKVRRKKRRGASSSPSSVSPPAAAQVAAAPAEPAPSNDTPSVPDLPSPKSEPERTDEPPAKPPPAKSADSEVQAILEGKVPTQKTPAKAAPPPESSLPETLEKSEIKRVIRRNTSGIVRCYNTKVSDKAAVKGALQITFTIQGSGRTTGIRVQRPDYWGSDFVGCAGNAVARWKFPRFKGEEIEITYPFMMGGF
jgi:predicted Zn finger-like uncharacterized protein